VVKIETELIEKDIEGIIVEDMGKAITTASLQGILLFQDMEDRLAQL